MRDLDWREIGVDALAAPFERWPVFLACALSALAVACVLISLHIGLLFLSTGGASDYFMFRLRYLSTTPHVLLAAIVFQWCWMTALLHPSRRHIATFPLHGNFWKCSAATILILFWLVLIWLTNRLLMALLVTIVQMLPQSAMQPAYWGLTYALAFAIYWLAILGVLRLMLWPTFMIADKQWRGLSSIWRVTRQFHRPLWIASLVLTILSVIYQVVVAIIYQAVYGTGLRVNSRDIIALPSFFVKIVLGLILFAAVGAGLARIYRLAATATSGNAAHEAATAP